MNSKPVLVTGATGYVGGRLVPRLLEAGYRVHALGRSLEKLRSRPWGKHPLIALARHVGRESVAHPAFCFSICSISWILQKDNVVLI